MRHSTTGARKIAVLTSLLAITAASCGGDGKSPLEIGVERSALDLVFKETDTDDAEGSPAPDAVGGLVPQDAPPRGAPDAGPGPTPAAPGSPPAAPVALCPEAGPDARPKEAAPTTITAPPREGVYSHHNEGTFELEGALSLKGAYPPRTTREIRLLDPEESERMRFQVTRRGFSDTVVEETYRVTGADGGDANLQLVRLFEKTSLGEMTFEPAPPVTIVGLGEGEGDTWSSAGMDPDTGTAMVVQGEIEKREVVDTCGEVHETYRVSSEESMVNLSTGFRRETEEPTVYNVATQLGGLFLREDVHSTTTWQTESGPVTLRLDYVSTADSGEPGPAS